MRTNTMTSKHGTKKAKAGKQTAKRHAAKRASTAKKSAVAQPTAMSILDMVEQMTSGLPEEVLDRLPTDGAQELDHYVYGTPKKTA